MIFKNFPNLKKTKYDSQDILKIYIFEKHREATLIPALKFKEQILKDKNETLHRVGQKFYQ